MRFEPFEAAWLRAETGFCRGSPCAKKTQKRRKNRFFEPPTDRLTLPLGAQSGTAGFVRPHTGIAAHNRGMKTLGQTAW
jgi:hypothetical protein